jgi:hypothetical protein
VYVKIVLNAVGIAEVEFEIACGATATALPAPRASPKLPVSCLLTLEIIFVFTKSETLMFGASMSRLTSDG